MIRFLLAGAVALALAACGSDSDPAAPALSGTYEFKDGADLHQLKFEGDSLTMRTYRQDCLQVDSRTAWELEGDSLRIIGGQIRIRESQEACGGDMGPWAPRASALKAMQVRNITAQGFEGYDPGSPTSPARWMTLRKL